MLKHTPLGAYSIDGTAFYTFTLDDLPVLITGDQLVLTARPKSPILNFNTLVRGDETSAVHEDDVIVYNNEDYDVFWDAGLCIKIGPSNVYLDDLESYEFKQHKVVTRKARDIRYRHRDTIFRLSDLTGFSEGLTVLSALPNKEERLVAVDDFCQHVATSNNVKHYLGDELSGGIVKYIGCKVVIEDEGYIRPLVQYNKGEV